MGNYKLSEKAATDLADIYEYGILTFGLSQAGSYVLSLHDRFHLLSQNTKMGRSATELSIELRRFKHQSHVIFYELQNSGVFIVRVLRDGMDFERHFQAE